MKRIVTFLFAMAMILTISSCSSNNNTENEQNISTEEYSEAIAIISRDNDETEIVTQEEIYNIYKENEVNYNTNYLGHDVKIEGKIATIEQQNNMIRFTLDGYGFVFQFSLDELNEMGIDISSLGSDTQISVYGKIGETFINTEINEPFDLDIICG